MFQEKITSQERSLLIQLRTKHKTGKMYIERNLGGQRSLLRLINFTNICHVHPA